MEEGPDRDALIGEILDLDRRCRELESLAGKSTLFAGKAATMGRQMLLYSVFGRSLTRNLGRLIASVREKRGPLFGPELAKTLDSAVNKLIGYKRWLVLFGSLAALPGLISMILLWQQNDVLDRELDNVHTDSKQWERGEYLATIYSVRDRSDLGYTTTPIFSASSRGEAVLKLIEHDRSELRRHRKRDILGLNQMVDISLAPLRDVDFSALPGKPPVKFVGVGFNGSNFLNASFEACELENVWFSTGSLENANFRGTTCRRVDFDKTYLFGVDFRGATFENCNFEEAVYDAGTQWPEGFRPEEFGAVMYRENQEGQQ